MERRLHFRRVALHTNKGAAIEGGRQELADAVGAFLVGNRDSEAPGFVLNLLLKNKVLQDLEGEAGFKELGNLALLSVLVDPVAHLLEADGLIAALGDGVGGDL